MKAPSVSPWAWMTLAASLATCGLAAALGTTDEDRTDFPTVAHLLGFIGLGLLLTVAACVTTYRDVRDSGGRLRGRELAWRFTAVAIAAVSLPLFVCPCVSSSRVRKGRRSPDSNNFKQIVLAFHNYAGANGDRLPPVAIRAPDGTPLLSWRVAILPYIDDDEARLYARFHLDEPWDSPHNITLLRQMPAVYRFHRSGRSAPRDKTHTQVLVGKGTPFERDGLKIPQDFPDGTSNTIGVIEAKVAVPWTKPEDLVYDPKGPPPAIGVPWTNDPAGQLPLVGLMDGSVRSLTPKISVATLRAGITRNGGETLGPDW